MAGAPYIIRAPSGSRYARSEMVPRVLSLRAAKAELAALWGSEHLEVGAIADDLATVLLFRGRQGEAESAIADARRIVLAAGFSYDHDRVV